MLVLCHYYNRTRMALCRLLNHSSGHYTWIRPFYTTFCHSKLLTIADDALLSASFLWLIRAFDRSSVLPDAATDGKCRYWYNGLRNHENCRIKVHYLSSIQGNVGKRLLNFMKTNDVRAIGNPRCISHRGNIGFIT